MSRVSQSLFYLRLYDTGSLTFKWPFQGSDIYLKEPIKGMNCFDSNKKIKPSLCFTEPQEYLFIFISFHFFSLIFPCTILMQSNFKSFTNTRIAKIFFSKLIHPNYSKEPRSVTAFDLSTFRFNPIRSQLETVLDV